MGTSGGPYGLQGGSVKQHWAELRPGRLSAALLMVQVFVLMLVVITGVQLM